MSAENLTLAAAIVSAFSALMCVVQWTTTGMIHWVYLWGLLALPIAWALTR